jgi:glutathionyl-hydroquinone reductase
MRREDRPPLRFRQTHEQANGEFRRQESRFRSWISADGSGEFP